MTNVGIADAAPEAGSRPFAKRALSLILAGAEMDSSPRVALARQRATEGTGIVSMHLDQR